GLDVGRVEIDELEARDLLDLGARDGPDLVFLRVAGALRYPGRLLQEVGRRRRLRLEGEGAVGVDGDDDRDFQVRFNLRVLRVEGLADLHDVDAVLPKSRADGRGRVGLAR